MRIMTDSVNSEPIEQSRPDATTDGLATNLAEGSSATATTPQLPVRESVSTPDQHNRGEVTELSAEVSSVQESTPPQPKTPQQKAEQRVRDRFFRILEEDWDLTDNELEELRREYDNQPLDAFVEFYNTLTPNWVYDPTTQDFNNPDLASQTASEGNPETNATVDQPTQEAKDAVDGGVPAIPENVAQFEVAGENTPETQSTDGTSKAIEALYRDAAWKEFYKTNLPGFIQDKFKGNYPNGAKYEDLTNDEKSVVEAEFKTFLKDTFLPNVAAGEFGLKNQKTLLESLSAGGMEWMVKGLKSSDVVAFMKNLFLQDAYRSGVEAGTFAHNKDEDKGKAVDVRDLKELCRWSNETGSTGKNKKNWMMLCGLIYRELQDDDEKIDPRTWAAEDKLDVDEMKKHMDELFQKCVTSGKTRVNEALVKAFEPENRNSAFSKPSYTQGYATPNLIAHFQMMANHGDYTENFFR